jgi:CHAT domain-containing protein
MALEPTQIEDSMGVTGSVDEAVRAADRAFNVGDIDGAERLYLHAREEALAGGDSATAAEIDNDRAAIRLLQDNYPGFDQLRQSADFAKRGSLSARSAALSTQEPSGNLLINGGFEEGLVPPWGGGRWERPEGNTKFGIWWNSGGARAYMKVDRDVRHSGKRSLRITNFSKVASGVFTTTAQRINGVRPSTVYCVSMFIKAQDLSPGAVTFAIDAGWNIRLPAVPPGTYDWLPYSADINIGHNAYIDFRIIHGDTGTVWLDDIHIEQLAPGAGNPLQADDPLQEVGALFDQGEYADALEMAEKLERQRPELHVWAHQFGVKVKAALGRFDQAFDDIAWLEQQNEIPVSADFDIGEFYETIGQHELAIKHYRRFAEAMQPRPGSQGDQGRYALVNERLARVHLMKAREAREAKAEENYKPALDEAERFLKEAQRTFDRIGNQYGEVMALRTLAKIALLKGEAETARPLVARALDEVAALEDPKLQSDLLLVRAEADIATDRLAEASEAIEKALETKQRIQDLLGLALAHDLRARLAEKRGQREAALEAYNAATDMIEKEYQTLGPLPAESRLRFLDLFRHVYAGYLARASEAIRHEPVRSAVLKEKSFEKAQWASLTTTTAALTQMTARFAVRNDKLAGTLRKLQDLDRRLQANEQRPIGVQSQRLVEREELRALRAEKAELKACVDNEFPAYAELISGKPCSISDVQGILEPNEALISFTFADNEAYLFVVRKGLAEFFALPVQRDEVAKMVGVLRDPLDPKGDALLRPFDVVKAHGLYWKLLGPADKLICDAAHLIVVPDGPLQSLPPSVLVTETPKGSIASASYSEIAWLVRRQAVSVMPAVSALVSLRRFAATPREESKCAPFVGFGNPDFGGGKTASVQAQAAIRLVSRFRGAGANIDGLRQLDPLPETAKELLAVAKILGAPDTNVYLGADATVSKVKSLDLSRTKVVSFATHGLTAGGPLKLGEPALAFTPPKEATQDDDGLLRASEVAQLKLDNADFVVLSACNTAASDGTMGAEMLSGLAKAFFYAGARSLLVSHWPVETAAAEKLTTGVFEALKSDPTIGRAQALCLSMRKMIDPFNTSARSKVETKAASTGATAKKAEDGPNASAPRASIPAPDAHPFYWAPFVLVGEGGGRT